MSVNSNEVELLRKFVKYNGYFQIPVVGKTSKDDEGCKICSNNNTCNYRWVESINFEFNHNDLGIDRHLENITSFELDTSDGQDSKFIKDLIARGTDMEPIWGDGLTSDPGERLLPADKAIKISECVTHIFERTDSHFPKSSFIVIDNAYGLICNKNGFMNIYDLQNINLLRSSAKPIKSFVLDEVTNKSCKDQKVIAESDRLLTVVKRLNSFLGVEALVFGTTYGCVLFFDAKKFIDKQSFTEPMLKFLFGHCISHVAAVDDIFSPISIVLIVSKKLLSLICFMEVYDEPLKLNLELSYEVYSLEFLSPSEEGFPFLIQTNSGIIKSFLLLRKDLYSGNLEFVIIDDFPASDISKNDSSCFSFHPLTENDFLPVSQYEFLTLCYNQKAKKQQLRRICQNSIILQSMPLYPSESNHLGMGSVLAHIEVPTPNYGLSYHNYLATEPINLRYFSYNLNSENYTDIYVNQKLHVYFSEFENNFHLARRFHGRGNAKIGRPSSTNLSASSSHRNLSSKVVSNLDSTTQEETLSDSLESLRLSTMKYGSFFKPKQYTYFNKGCITLNQKFRSHFISLVGPHSKITEECKFRNILPNQIIEKLNVTLPEDAVQAHYKPAPYVDQLLKKYLQLNVESKFDFDGPKFNSHISQRQFIFTLNSELSTSLFGVDPIIINASSQKLLPPEINCNDNMIEWTILCHLKPLCYVAAASSSGFVFLFRLTTWRGIFAYRFEKLLNVNKLEDVCEESDEEDRIDFCQTTRLSSSELDSSLTSCRRCRIIVKHPSVHSLDYVYHSESNSVTLYVYTPTSLSEYQIFA